MALRIRFCEAKSNELNFLLKDWGYFGLTTYCVAHVQKFTGGSIGAMEKHLEHSAKNSKNNDIDPERTHLNENILDDGSGRTLREKIKAVTDTRKNPDVKIRKDAILFCSVLVSASPEFFEGKSKEECMEYFKCAAGHLQERYGKENCVGAHVHFDEKTPHMHFVFVPMTKDRRLSSKEINSRGKLRNLQDELPKQLRRDGFDVKRGEENSPQIHTDTRVWKKDQRVMQMSRAELKKAINIPYEEEKKLTFTGMKPTGRVIVSQGDLRKVQFIASQAVPLIQNETEKQKEKAAISKEWFDLQQKRMELDEKEKALDSRDGKLLLQKAEDYVKNIPELPEVKMKVDRLATDRLKKENPERYQQLRRYYVKKVQTDTLNLQKDRQKGTLKRP
jgi:hypothetical protein